MAKVDLVPVTNLENEASAVGTINENFNKLGQALDNTLSRDGSTPNPMEDELDMNSNRIINLPQAVSDLEPVRKREFDAAVFGSLGLHPDDLGIVVYTGVQAETVSLVAGPNIVISNGSGTSGNPTIAVDAAPTGLTIDGLNNTLTNVSSDEVLGLADVATSGSYNDLSDRPSIPAAGIPSGGSTNQVLQKTSDSDYAVDWADGGTGDMLASVYAPRIYDFNTVSDIQAATVVAAQDIVRTGGYYTAGDGGHAMYKRVVSLGTDQIGFQSADGAWWQLILAGRVSVKACGAKGDGVTDDSTAINAGIKAVLATKRAGDSIGGTVYLPPPDVGYRLASALFLSPGITLEGDGGFSTLIADDCDAIYLVGVTGFQSIRITGLTIRHVNSTAKRYAIVQPGDATSTNAILCGITLRDLIIDSADCPISLLTSMFVVIDNIWGQNVGSGIEVNGRSYVVYISNSKFVKTSAVGASAFGSGVGINIQPFTYTDLPPDDPGGSPTKPEGIQIINTELFGFDVGVLNASSYVITCRGMDIDARVYGMDFTAPVGGVVIRDSVIIIRGSSAAYGIILRGRTANPINNIIIDSCNITAADLASNPAFGIVVNETGANQDNVTISNNLIVDMSGYDIWAASPGNVKIINNTTLQSGVVASPDITSVLVGTRANGLIVVEKNTLARALNYGTPSDVTNGYIVARDNVVAGVII